MDQKRLRVALFGRFYSEGGESIESQKDKPHEFLIKNFLNLWIWLPLRIPIT
jgi:hypothetical protein